MSPLAPRTRESSSTMASSLQPNMSSVKPRSSRTDKSLLWQAQPADGIRRVFVSSWLSHRAAGYPPKAPEGGG
jgi:hypothetical protein